MDHALQAIVGGIAFLVVQAIGNALKPFIKKLKDRIVKFFTKNNNEG